MQLFQFKITLRDSQPPIWRRVVLPDCTLAGLHRYIQAAFDWDDCHLHMFIIDGLEYGPPDVEFDGEDEASITLSGLLPPSTTKAKWRYVYDFGDNWEHIVLFEKFVTADPKVKYPVCLKGSRVAPEEDSGGIWGANDEATDADEDAFDPAVVTIKLLRVSKTL